MSTTRPNTRPPGSTMPPPPCLPIAPTPLLGVSQSSCLKKKSWGVHGHLTAHLLLNFRAEISPTPAHQQCHRCTPAYHPCGHPSSTLRSSCADKLPEHVWQAGPNAWLSVWSAHHSRVLVQPNGTRPAGLHVHRWQDTPGQVRVVLNKKKIPSQHVQ